jgi:predicted NAD-dependent protein-ADP-ribosyltransferase YbiA (DUF1768 family)
MDLSLREMLFFFYEDKAPGASFLSNLHVLNLKRSLSGGAGGYTSTEAMFQAAKIDKDLLTHEGAEEDLDLYRKAFTHATTGNSGYLLGNLKSQYPIKFSANAPFATVNEAVRFAKSKQFKIDKDKWSTVSEGVMRKALLAKFTLQSSEGRELLDSTGDAPLIEKPPGSRDTWWGVDLEGLVNQTGNRLGALLEERRETLATEQKSMEERGILQN